MLLLRCPSHLGGMGVSNTDQEAVGLVQTEGMRKKESFEKTLIATIFFFLTHGAGMSQRHVDV